MLHGSEYLKSDFEQCFSQMRHYDKTFISVTKMILGGYTAIIVASTALLGIGLQRRVVLTGIGALLLFASVSATILIDYLMNNRHNYTVVARYVNEIRCNYLKDVSLDIKNIAGMNTDCYEPKHWNKGSSHVKLLNFIAVLNAASFSIPFSILIYLVFPSSRATILPYAALSGVIFIIAVVFQFNWIWQFLTSKDKENLPRSGKHKGR